MPPPCPGMACGGPRRGNANLRNESETTALAAAQTPHGLAGARAGPCRGNNRDGETCKAPPVSGRRFIAQRVWAPRSTLAGFFMSSGVGCSRLACRRESIRVQSLTSPPPGAVEQGGPSDHQPL